MLAPLPRVAISFALLWPHQSPSHPTYLNVLLFLTLLHILNYLGCHKALSFFLPPCLDLAYFFLFLSHLLPSS